MKMVLISIIAQRANLISETGERLRQNVVCRANVRSGVYYRYMERDCIVLQIYMMCEFFGTMLQCQEITMVYNKNKSTVFVCYDNVRQIFGPPSCFISMPTRVFSCENINSIKIWHIIWTRCAWNTCTYWNQFLK